MNEVYHGVIMDIMGGMVGIQWDRNDIGMNLSEHSLGKNQFHALVLSSIFRQNHCYHSYPLEPPSHHHPISYSTHIHTNIMFARSGRKQNKLHMKTCFGSVSAFFFGTIHPNAVERYSNWKPFETTEQPQITQNQIPFFSGEIPIW